MNFYRTHFCSDLSISNLNSEVTLSGWIDTVRDHGNLIFIDLRDNYGITQCVVDAKHKIFDEISDTMLHIVSRKSDADFRQLYCSISLPSIFFSK